MHWEARSRQRRRDQRWGGSPSEERPRGCHLKPVEAVKPPQLSELPRRERSAVRPCDEEVDADSRSFSEASLGRPTPTPPRRSPTPRPIRLVGLGDRSRGGKPRPMRRSRSYSVPSRHDSSSARLHGGRRGSISSSSSSSSSEPRALGRRARFFDIAPSGGESPLTPRQKLEGLLDAAASLSRAAVAEVMVFCLDNSSAAQDHANQVVSRLLDRPPGPLQSRDVASLCCLSDVLHNACHAHRTPGAAAYRHTFQDALPGIMRRLREGMADGSGQCSLLSQPTAEAAVRRVLQAWRAWEVFPEPLLQGLEAIVFGGALEPPTTISALPGAGSRLAPAPRDSLRPEVSDVFSPSTSLALRPCEQGGLSGGKQDPAVRSRLEAFAAMDSATLERHCKSRGLAGGGGREEPATRATLLGRLRSFEEYWARRPSKNGQALRSEAAASVASAPPTGSSAQTLLLDEDVDGEPVDLSALLRHKARLKANAAAGAPSAAPRCTSAAEAGADDLDGQPIGVLELQRWRAAAAAGAAGGGIIASASRAAVPGVSGPSEDFAGDAIGALLAAASQEAAAAAPPAHERLSTGRRAASNPCEAPLLHAGALGAHQAGDVEAARVEDEQSLQQRAHHQHRALASRKERSAKHRDRSSRRHQRHSKHLPRERREHRQGRERSRSRRRRRREAAAGCPAEASVAATAAAAAAAAAANAAAFLSARSRAPVAPVLAPTQAFAPLVDATAGVAAASGTPAWSGSGLAAAGPPSPEPDDELDGDPLDSGDEQHIMLQEKLAEKKRQLLRQRR